MITLVIWSVVMLAALVSAGIAIFLGYQSTERQLLIDEMLSHKHPRQYELKAETGAFAMSNAKANLLVEEGKEVDVSRAEEPDR